LGNLLYWALMFLIVALVAAALGFGGVAGTAMAGAVDEMLTRLLAQRFRR
jgi:uncharacterized membrane protein YtjA (UPF0391 family)